MQERGTLFLIPSPLGDRAPVDTLPDAARRAIGRLDLLLVESERSARRHLARLGAARADLPLGELSEHSRTADLEPYLEELERGKSVGVMSDAGSPGIADPGAELARRCHERGIRVVALPGPSSVTLAVMASGLGGQRFAFSGYLPVEREARIRRIRELEARARSRRETQVFMETPYRNLKLFADIVETCRPDTALCVACDLTTEDEYVRTWPVSRWRAETPPIHKRPALFLLGA